MPISLPESRIWNCSNATASRVEERSFAKLEEALDQVIVDWEAKRADYETEALIFFTEREAEHAYLYIEEKLKNLDPDGEYQLSYMNRDSQNFKKV